MNCRTNARIEYNKFTLLKNKNNFVIIITTKKIFYYIQSQMKFKPVTMDITSPNGLDH